MNSEKFRKIVNLGAKTEYRTNLAKKIFTEAQILIENPDSGIRENSRIPKKKNIEKRF